ncbi:MAG TPA: extracellular solute-binding protein [Xanthobacteraceae bacterium]|nr:extracellular solute-binding protein [Xanthobacteraceae bacterium]
MIKVSRRDLILAAGAAALAGLPAGAPRARANAAPTHGLSAFGDLQYPADFAQFAYVDPGAPKGGAFIQLAGAGGSTFNSLNPFILKGDPAFDMELSFASMMARNFDEPDAVYALAAESVEVSDDARNYQFRLRDGIKFHDGTAITAADVVYSLVTLKEQGRPNYRVVLRDLEMAEAENDRTVLLRFAAGRGRDAPVLAASMPILSKTYYATRTFDETTLEGPLGSGPYRVARLEQGRYVEFERVKDWWGAELPVNRGHYNFDVIRSEYYRDRDVAFEGFTGKNYLFREEFTSRMWATRYDFAAMRDGRAKREVIPDERPSGAQGWILNTRRDKFKDPRVREAFAIAFDFEWTNKNIMFGSYERTHSYFQNSDMMAKGNPTPQELALLEPFRGKVPEDVFGEPWTPPVTDGSGQDRRLLRQAAQLLTAAGWPIKDGKRVNARGERLEVEFLFVDRTFEPHHQTYVKNLTLLGVTPTLRLVDPVQYRVRTEDFDFDITVTRMIFPQTPGDTLRNYFSSQSAATKGSFNLAGISDPVVDTLIEQAIAADTRDELTAACRALDRVLRAGRYWVPHWYKGTHWLAYWDVFSRPKTKPRYARGAPETWWYDRDKAAKAERAG